MAGLLALIALACVVAVVNYLRDDEPDFPRERLAHPDDPTAKDLRDALRSLARDTPNRVWPEPTCFTELANKSAPAAVKSPGA